MNRGQSENSRPISASPTERLLLVDALKGIAAQIILLHHLASYGPLADVASRIWPMLSLWFFEYGRMAVQVFLVVAGFLAARGLARDGVPGERNPLRLIWQRYSRLAPPFIVAMLIALLVALLAGRWMQDEAIPEVIDLRQFVAHGLLLHGILDVPSLSVGVWYVAIDLQLYAMLVLVLWLAGRLGARSAAMPAMLLVALLGGLSLFVFNRYSALDAWGIYFFGSYALGAFAWWLADARRSLLGPLLMAAVVVAALGVEFRLRIALALAVSLLLALARRQGWLSRWPNSEVLAFLGRISFSVFLLHFPVYLLVSALYVRLGGEGGGTSAVPAMLLAWALSIYAGTLFLRYVESRQRWLPTSWSANLRALFSARRS